MVLAFMAQKQNLNPAGGIVLAHAPGFGGGGPFGTTIGQQQH
jgi:hypothetical protein